MAVSGAEVAAVNVPGVVAGRPGRPVVAAGAPGRPIVFVDKDGTLVEDEPYNVDPDRIRLVGGAARSLSALSAAGFGLVLATNQSGIARGLFEADALRHYFECLREMLAAAGVRFEAIAYCPHHPAGVNEYAVECDCRKPAPGLLQCAGAALAADMGRSWMIGDILDDVEAGHRAGCRSVLVDRGHETEWRTGEHREPDIVTGSLEEAAQAILATLAAERASAAEAPAGAERGERGEPAAAGRAPATERGPAAPEHAPSATDPRNHPEALP